MAARTQSVSCVDLPTHAANNNACFIVIQSGARLLNANTSAIRGVPGEIKLQLHWLFACAEVGEMQWRQLTECKFGVDLYRLILSDNVTFCYKNALEEEM
jgi:hypothetical protein